MAKKTRNTGSHGSDPSHGFPTPQHFSQAPQQHQNPMYGGHTVPPSHMGAPAQQMQAQMMQMMQMMTGMQSGGFLGSPSVAHPFTQTELLEEEDPGLDADIIRPHQLRSVIKTQQPLPLDNILDYLCLTEDGKNSLGGIPKGCTIALVGPPGKGKTRTAIAALCKVALSGTRCAFVVAEEGFIDENDSGRDDLCSRLAKIGMQSLSLTEAQFQKKVAKNIAVLLSQYHKGGSWDSFVARYRFIVEKEGIKFVIIDSLNTLDPSRNRTADNLSALKTYNHEKGVTCVTIGQIRDTGMPVGGEALIHTADTVFLMEEMGLSSKDIAAVWGGQYRDRITTIKTLKSVTTPIFPHPLRVDTDSTTGVMQLHSAQPNEFRPYPRVGEEVSTPSEAVDAVEASEEVTKEAPPAVEEKAEEKPKAKKPRAKKKKASEKEE